MIIHFKTGEKKIITFEIAEKIKEKLIIGNAANFQCFFNTNGNLILMLNISEILYID